MFFIIISFFGSERPEALSVAKGDGERWISVGGSRRSSPSSNSKFWN